jgi:hypothetical protein
MMDAPNDYMQIDLNGEALLYSHRGANKETMLKWKVAYYQISPLQGD